MVADTQNTPDFGPNVLDMVPVHPRASGSLAGQRESVRGEMTLGEWEDYHYDGLKKAYWQWIRTNTAALGQVSWPRWVRFCYEHSSRVRYSHDM